MTKFNVAILDKVTINGERKSFDVTPSTKSFISYLIGRSRSVNYLHTKTDWQSLKAK